MGKAVYITEKPSVAQEFARALGYDWNRADGYMESKEAVITWCYGHLVTMSYPEAYDEKYKKWDLAALPFIPETYRYEVIGSSKKQFGTVKKLLTGKDTDTIYVCTDSGREGEYIYRLVEQMAKVKGKKRLRVWIDSQTEEEILNGIRNAKDLSEYDSLAESAYLRAKEDYLMGINFSRLLTLKYGRVISSCMNTKHTVISVGRVMTCVLGMTVRREREIREFVKTPFFKVRAFLDCRGESLSAEWKATAGSRHMNAPYLYKDSGFTDRERAKEFIRELESRKPVTAAVSRIEKKNEKKNPPLLFNLAELQNICSQNFKLRPDQTLKVVQELYEKKLVTYPRTDARVLSSAIAKEIYKNIRGLTALPKTGEYASQILESGRYKNIVKTRYVNDSQITDHYAIIPTGQGLKALKSLTPEARGIYEIIVRRFLSIFYPPAVYRKYDLDIVTDGEHFFAGFKILSDRGWMEAAGYEEDEKTQKENDHVLISAVESLSVGDILPIQRFSVKSGETAPPKRYTSGTMILAMENAGQLIEDEELRAEIKGSGIGTSATRADILKKLVKDRYLALSRRTQVITPTLLGEVIYDTVHASIRSLLNPELTASWERGLGYVAAGSVTGDEYMQKLEDFIRKRTQDVIQLDNSSDVREFYARDRQYYHKNGA